MKDLEFRLQKRGIGYMDQVNAVDEALVFEEKLNVEEEVEDFIDLNKKRSLHN
jgi:hypothetical protein